MNFTLSRRGFVAAVAVAPLVPPVLSTVAFVIPTSGVVPMSQSDNAKLVHTMVDALFNNHDLSAIDQFVDPAFVDHGSLIGGTIHDLRAFVGHLAPEAGYEGVRTLSDGGLVALHGRYTGVAATPLVAFDIYQVLDGRVQAHWGGVQPEADPNPSGRTMLDGPTVITAPTATDESRSLVEAFAEIVLIGGDFSRLSDFISSSTYIQHNPAMADGLTGMGAAMETLASQGMAVRYDHLDRTVAEGEFVLMQLGGEFGVPVTYFDLFRVDQGRIVEHWDVIEPIPTDQSLTPGIG